MWLCDAGDLFCQGAELEGNVLDLEISYCSFSVVVYTTKPKIIQVQHNGTISKAKVCFMHKRTKQS